MKVSVIVSTYNSPQWLEKVLWGYSCQTFGDFELLVADDGSDGRTAELLARIPHETGLAPIHVWQEDHGFRKCRILNKAIRRASGDYLIFSDGDCIPRRDFVETHVRQAQPGSFLSGSYIKLPLPASQVIGRDDILSGACFRLAWLRQRGLGMQRKAWMKLPVPPALGRVLNRLTTTRCNLKGSNASAWKKDILAVNGFDERMPWGGEDRECGVRLRNLGIRARHVRFDAIVVHLDHARGYVDPVQVLNNKALRQRSEREGIRWTDFGIAQLPAGGTD